MLRLIRDWQSFFGVLLVAGAGAGGGILWWESQLARQPSLAYAQQAATADTARANLSVFAAADQLSAAFREVARATKPSVVSIKAIAEVRQRQTARRGAPRGIPPELEPFFGGQFPGFEFGFPETPQDEGGGIERQYGQGSGVIVSPEGHILTNNHVVEKADKLEVVLSDDRTFEAKVIGTDPKTDIAVIKIDAKGLVAASIGDSSLMQVGDWVIAIGSPFGLSQTVTSGIVSATHRENFDQNQYSDFIQTDAAINPGNSGGPLLNLRGEVIGINTAIKSQSGGFIGLGFAVPSNTADSVMKSIIKYGKVTRGYIGTSIATITPKNYEEFGVPANTEGAYVQVVAKGGPAEKGGLQPGDIVTGINGQKIKSSEQLKQTVATLPINQPSKFEILRDGKTKTLSITIEEQTDEKLAALSGSGTASSLGLSVETVPPEVAKELGLTAQDGGVMVTEVNRGSQLAQYLRVGEVIVSVNNQRVSTPEDFVAAIGSNKGNILRLIVKNNLSTRQIIIPMTKR
jgi:serine protease Do